MIDLRQQPRWSSMEFDGRAPLRRRAGILEHVSRLDGNSTEGNSRRAEKRLTHRRDRGARDGVGARGADGAAGCEPLAVLSFRTRSNSRCVMTSPNRSTSWHRRVVRPYHDELMGTSSVMSGADPPPLRAESSSFGGGSPDGVRSRPGSSSASMRRRRCGRVSRTLASSSALVGRGGDGKRPPPRVSQRASRPRGAIAPAGSIRFGDVGRRADRVRRIPSATSPAMHRAPNSPRRGGWVWRDGRSGWVEERHDEIQPVALAAKSSGEPFCQQFHSARGAWTYSRIHAAGADQRTP